MYLGVFCYIARCVPSIETVMGFVTFIWCVYTDDTLVLLTIIELLYCLASVFNLPVV